MNLPFDKLLKLECVCVEHNGNIDYRRDFDTKMTEYGFSGILTNAENTVYTKGK